MDLPHLKFVKSGNAKYRRRVTSPQMQAMLGTKAVEWTLKTRDPLKIVDAWKIAHSKFEALLAKAENTTIDQVSWDILHSAAVAHGIARPDASRIGPVDSNLEGGRFDAFTVAALAEADKLTAAQMSVPFAKKPPPSAFGLLAKAQLFGMERPPMLLSTVVAAYLKDRESKASYNDIAKLTALVVKGLEAAMGQIDPPLTSINRESAYAYRDSLTAKGNSAGTVRRRITTIKAVLNHADKRFDIPDWRNPFNKMELPQDDGEAGEAGEAGEDKRDPLTLEDIRKVQAIHSGLNQDAKDIWHLMMFTGIGPNEARGLQWSEVHFDHPTPHFEIRGNSLRRVKVGERRRRVPLVGTVLTTMQTRKAQAPQNDPNVFPRYAGHKNANSLSKALVNPMRDAKVWVYLRKVPYSLRHSMKDWLRRTTPTNIQLLIMGHGHGEGRAAGGYGGDDLLEIQAEHLEKALRFGGVIEYPKLPVKIGS